MGLKTIQSKYAALNHALDERGRRLWAATEAKSLGRGGIALVERATGISRSTIARGIREVDSGEILEVGRVRRSGAGRKPLTESDKTLVLDLDALVEPSVSGDPQSPLRWTSKSVRKLAAELVAMGHDVSYRSVYQKRVSTAS